MERWLSGLKQRFAKAPYLKRVPGVRIPPSPPPACQAVEDEVSSSFVMSYDDDKGHNGGTQPAPNKVAKHRNLLRRNGVFYFRLPIHSCRPSKGRSFRQQEGNQGVPQNQRSPGSRSSRRNPKSLLGRAIRGRAAQAETVGARIYRRRPKEVATVANFQGGVGPLSDFSCHQAANSGRVGCLCPAPCVRPAWARCKWGESPL